MTKIKIKMNHMIQYIDIPPHLLAMGGGGNDSLFCIHVIHPIETPECYIYEQRDSICGVGVYHTFLVV